VGRIAALADDLALAMRAPSLRIVGADPGEGRRRHRSAEPDAAMVHVRELIEGVEYHRPTRALPIALARTSRASPWSRIWPRCRTS